MRHKFPPRLLALAPSSKGFGFAVLEGEMTLVDWGTRSAVGNKNASCLQRAEKLISHYLPTVLVIENYRHKSTRRAKRIQELGEDLKVLAHDHKIKVSEITREQIKRHLRANGKGTKHDMAVVLARAFPEQLESMVPPKRKPWMSQDFRMDVFDAIALAVTFTLKRAKRKRSAQK